MKHFIIDIIMISLSINCHSQIKISGCILDNETGDLIVSAVITEKGTTDGTITDIDGNFSLSVNDSSSITVTFIGYSTEEIVVTHDNLNSQIFLLPYLMALEEVTVIGYGSNFIRGLIGSISQATYKISRRNINKLSSITSYNYETL
jgi:hypothetical protein